MGVNILITEEQKKVLIVESLGSKLGDIIKDSYEFMRRTLDEVKGITKTNLEFLLTWGSAIGGFMGPINDWVSEKHPELSDIELSLIITAIAATIFLDNKKTIRDLLKLLNEKNLSEIYLEGLKKSEDLKKVFFSFIGSLNITFNKVTNMLAYSFLIPLLPMLFQISDDDFDVRQIKQIVVRIMSFGLLTISSIILRELITKILKRFSRK
jgi:hypothetical protein